MIVDELNIRRSRCVLYDKICFNPLVTLVNVRNGITKQFLSISTAKSETVHELHLRAFNQQC